MALTKKKKIGYGITVVLIIALAILYFTQREQEPALTLRAVPAYIEQYETRVIPRLEKRIERERRVHGSDAPEPFTEMDGLLAEVRADLRELRNADDQREVTSIDARIRNNVETIRTKLGSLQ